MFTNPVDEFQARILIQETLLRFCRGIDRKDWPLLLSAFHDDATDDHGWVRGRVHDVLVPALRARHEAVEHAAHHLTNVSIEFVSTARASVESYVLVLQRQPGAHGAGAERTIAAVRYVDTFERRHEDWLIARRVLVYGDMVTVTDDQPFSLPGTFIQQARDGSDPISVQENALGVRRPQATPSPEA